MPGATLFTLQDLRSLISRAEALVSRLGPGASGGDVIELLDCLDQIAQVRTELSAQGGDVRAEDGRVETVQRALAAHSAEAVRLVGDRERWDQLRVERSSSPPAWWWLLDQRVVRERRRWRWRAAVSLLALGVLVAIAAWVYGRYLAPDEQVVRKARHLSRAQDCVQEGDLACALEQARLALALAPDDPEISLKVAVLLDAVGQPAEAESAYDRVIGLYGDQALFLAMRGQEYLALGWYDRALDDGLAATQVDAGLALSYCTQGSAYEELGDRELAVQGFQLCAECAAAQGQDELVVLASARLAALLQDRP